MGKTKKQQHRKCTGLFITGTDTGVGKTYVAALIARQLCQEGLRVGVYKPVASGCRQERGRLVPEDALNLWEAAGRPATLERVCPQYFAAPLAPHLAAALEGKKVDWAEILSGARFWQSHCELLIVEGVGGLMSPLDEDHYVADLASRLGYPLVVVTRNALGAINHTLQTLIAACAFEDGLPIAGVVINDTLPPGQDLSAEYNPRELERRCGPPILARVHFGAKEFDRKVDWASLATPGKDLDQEPASEW
ncbi:MAG: dethiobiotin synthase [Thermoguttaceae bacterium]|nr:dethiobiotin synthase [Thermoguttaceae bacterium]MDW8077348.1 dethiobiotin synthase [Thermoguttaceae bacterium]